MKFRTRMDDMIGSSWHKYAVARTGINLPNCFTATTMLISEAIGYNQSLDDAKVLGAGALWEYHHPNFIKSKYAKPGALMIWKGGPDGLGHVGFCEKIVSNTVVGWLESNWYDKSKLSEYKELNPNYAFSNLTFMGYLIHKDLDKNVTDHIALTSENAVATLKVDGVNARLDSPNGKVVRVYNTGDKVKYTHKCQANGHRYVVWKEHEKKIFMAVSATEERPAPGSAEEWATFSAIGEEKPIPKPNDLLKNVKAYGVDVSEHNGKIDISKYGFVIIRASWGENKDKLLDYFVDECKRHGVPYGFYHYSYALNDEQLKAETDFFLETIKGYKPLLGCWCDMEDADGWKQKHNVLTREWCSEVVNYFCDTVSKRGYYAGVYSTPDWFNRLSITKYPKWYAHWGTNDGTVQYDYSNECVLYQYSAFTGIDMDLSYVDLLELKKEKSNEELLNDIKKAVQQLEERLG